VNEAKPFRRVARELSARSAAEMSANDDLRTLLHESLHELGDKWDVHLPVFLTAASLARVLWLDFVYQKAIEVPGQLVEFGSQWGASLNVFLLLKLIREPWNAGRVINSFSTFAEGFVAVDSKDGQATAAGDYAVKTGWEHALQAILEKHAVRSAIGAANNAKIIPGDATQTFPVWLEQNPKALISHAHFDMDVYWPTKQILPLCLPRMPKGAVLIFDELNCPSFPGETVAVQEILGVRGLALRKSGYQPYSAYCIIE